MRSGRSRLIQVPARQDPTVVLSLVSADASTANQPGPLSTTVRQAPEHAMDAPSSIAAVS